MRLIHISDPHLTNPQHRLRGRSHRGKRYLGLASWRRGRRHRHQRIWLDELLGAVRAAQPDQILVTGDLTHIGLPEEIEEARGWLDDLGGAAEVVLVPGNHDNYAADSWEAVVAHWGDYLHLADGYPIVRRFADIELWGVCTAVPTRPASACGLVGDVQRSRLQEHLAQAHTGPRLLALHHPPLPGMIGFRKRLRDADALAGILAERTVDIVLHGHGHKNRASKAAGARIYAVGSASTEDASFRCIDIQREGGGWRIGVSLHTRGPDGFTVADHDAWWKPGPYSEIQRKASDGVMVNPAPVDS